jgi:predicted aldo/keto reductase-like oxidoreductase
MESMRLGRTELRVSRVGFGGIPIQRLGEEEAIAVVQRCLELGVTFIDTANAYTTSEARIGKALARLREQGRPAQTILATKTWERSRSGAWRHLELSLKRLQVEAVDLWQFHNLGSFDAYEQVLEPGGAMEAAQQALREGKARHIGFSSHSMEVALEAVASDRFATVQFPFNFVTNEAAEKLLPLAREHDVGFIAMKPLAGGMLDNARLAIKYLLQFDNVLPDPGIQRVEEIEEIAEIVVGPWALSAEEQREIEDIQAEADARFCRRCGYCEPCEQGVRISLLMNLRSFWKRFPVERVTSGNIGDAVGGAGTCIECGDCEEKCPYRLPIREMIAENVEFYERALAGVQG